MNVRFIMRNTLFRVVVAAFAVMASMVSFAQVATVTDQPDFFSNASSLWGPGSPSAKLSFRQDLINIDAQGTLDSFFGMDFKTLPAVFEGPIQGICPAGTFPDLDFANNACFSCPDGYTQNPALLVSDPNVCFKLSDFTRASRSGDAQFLCPAGQFPDALLQSCYSCPPGSSQNPLIPPGLPGSCKSNTTAVKQRGNAAFCDSGDFPNGSLTACYDCQSGYSQNPALDVNTSGVCFDSGFSDNCWSSCYLWNFSGDCVARERVCGVPTPWYSSKKARYQYDLGCNAGEFSGGVVDPNGCYSCPSGTQQNGALPVNVPGVCFANTSAVKEQKPSFICNSGEFFDLGTGACYSCPTGYIQNPAFPASVTGACYKQSFSTATEQGAEGLFCPVGQFLDAVSGDCYSCAEGYDWNPLVGVNQSGACVNWSTLNVQGNPSNASFEIGYGINYDIKHLDGVEGSLSADTGNVDITYRPKVEVEVVSKASSDGLEHYQINTRLRSGEGELSMSTEWPRVDMEVDLYSNYDYLVDGEFKNVELNGLGEWEQKSRVDTLFDISTNGEVNPSRAVDPFLKFGLGSTGLDLKILGIGVQNYVQGFDPPIELNGSFFKDPTGYSPGLDFVGTPVAEIGLTPPILNTPPAVDPPDTLDRNRFRSDYTQDIMLGASSADVSIRQRITASSRSDFRLKVLGGSAQETDVLRFDIDIDGIVSTVYTNGVLATGYLLTIPTGVPLVSLMTLSASLIDLDLGMVFSLQPEYTFEPNPDVTLRFSPSVLVWDARVNTYLRVSEKTLPIGDSLEFIHPGGNLSILPVYSVSRNVFNNNTDLMVTPLIEGEINSVELKVLGVPPEEIPKKVAVQLTGATPDAIKILDVNFSEQPLSKTVWVSEQNGALSGLSNVEIDLLYAQYVQRYLDVLSFSLDGFIPVEGTPMQILGTHDQPQARCQDASVQLNGQGIAALSTAMIDAGSTDANGEALFSLSLNQSEFSCAEFGPNLVTLSAIDTVGAEATCQATVTVMDTLAPIGILPDLLLLSEGERYQFDAEIRDNCGNIDFDWVFPNGELSDAAQPAHDFCVLGEQQIEFSANDGLGNIRTELIPVTVENLPPVAEAGNDVNGFEGRTVVLDGAQFQDAGLISHQLQINWGDGSDTELRSVVNTTDKDCGFTVPVVAEHVYAQDGDYTITLRVEDSSGAIHVDTTTAHIANLAPVIDSLEVTGRPESEFEQGLYLYSGDSLEFNLSYHDEGLRDANQLTVDWDLHGVASVVTDLGTSAVSSGSTSGSKRYFKPGRYTLRFILEDDEGAQDIKEVSLQVKALTVDMDFISGDPENTIYDGMKAPLRTVLFSGEHELGAYHVNDIDTDTLVLGPDRVAALHKIYDLLVVSFQGNVIARYRDFNGDDVVDVEVQFDPETIGVTADDRSIVLLGRFVDGRYFEARDRLNVAASRAQYIRMISAILMLIGDE